MTLPAEASRPGPGLAATATVEQGSFVLDVTLAVSPGEVLGVLGPNGAGKTTMLRTLAGLTRLSRGQIVLDGVVLDDPASDRFVPTAHRPVGLVFQDYRLFPHLSVRDNVAFSARSRRLGRGPSRQLADGWLARLGLSALADQRPGQCSGGQAQRVALARALAADPALLLLDEPLSALDARTRLDVRAELHKHLAAFPGPALVVTHDPVEAMLLADRLVVLEDGLVVQQGDSATVAQRPATDYVARLVGLNLFAGTLGRSAGPLVVNLDAGLPFTVAAGAEVNNHPGRVLVAVRPSAIAVHLEPPGPASPRNVWPATVAGIELVGDRARLQVGGQLGAVVDLTPAAVVELGLRPGTPVWLSAKATDIECYPG